MRYFNALSKVYFLGCGCLQSVVGVSEARVSRLFSVLFYKINYRFAIEIIENENPPLKVYRWPFYNVKSVDTAELCIYSDGTFNQCNLLAFAANWNCGHFEIYCPATGKCLNKTLQCNNQKDCPDWSDEAHCRKNSLFLTNFTVGCNVEERRWGVCVVA